MRIEDDLERLRQDRNRRISPVAGQHADLAEMIAGPDTQQLDLALGYDRRYGEIAKNRRAAAILNDNLCRPGPCRGIPNKTRRCSRE
jgi:hypothetical protein